MSHEWPLLGGREPEAERMPPAPLNFYAQVAAVRGGEAVEAFARRRAGQVSAGHTAESDLAKDPHHIALRAKHNLVCFLEIAAPGRMNLPPLSRGECLARIEAAGAVLIALWERCQVEVGDDGVPSGQPQRRRE